jgi:CRISPR-associated Cas5-like protein
MLRPKRAQLPPAAAGCFQLKRRGNMGSESNQSSRQYACSPGMKVERVSYDIITPSAARGIIEAVYWKPAIRWVIDKIHVLNEIEFTNIRRNEVSEKVSESEVRQRMKGSNEPFY